LNRKKWCWSQKHNQPARQKPTPSIKTGPTSVKGGYSNSGKGEKKKRKSEGGQKKRDRASAETGGGQNRTTPFGGKKTSIKWRVSPKTNEKEKGRGGRFIRNGKGARKADRDSEKIAKKNWFEPVQNKGAQQMWGT